MVLKRDRETQEFLSKQSSRALSVFRHAAHLRDTDRAVLTPDGRLYFTQGLFGDAYQLLQARLNDLQEIMAKPEVYF
jgi:hypothetical protein